MPRKKILLVDGSSTILMMEKVILRNDPYVLITASNGEEAARKAASEQPDLILLDGSCFDAWRLIRDVGSRHVPIIVVTTRDEAANVETGSGSGCTDYVTKPIHAVELLAKVRALLGGDASEVAQ